MDLVDQYLISLRADGCTPATMAWHRAALTMFRNRRQLQDIDFSPELWSPVVLRQYIIWTSERVSPRTGQPLSASSVNSMIRSLKAFTRWLLKEEVTGHDLFARVSVPKAPELVMATLTPVDIVKLVQVSRSTGRHPVRDEALICFMLDTGAREVCGLDLTAINFDHGLARLYGKGRKERFVPFSSQTAKVMLRYLRNDRPDGPGPFLLSDRGRRLTRSGLRQLIERIGFRAGVECHPHMLRQTMATEYLRGGGNVLALQRILGHTELAVTTRYVSMSTDHLSDAHALFSLVTRLVK